MSFATGPGLRDLLTVWLRGAGLDAGVRYAYVDPAGRAPDWAHLKPSPEYWAQFIRISAFPVSMGAELAPLEELLRATPGCVATRMITEHASLRPQVQAVFDRKAVA